MKVQTMGLGWIVVKDLKEAVKFYTEVVGLKLCHENVEFGWAELEGHLGGARLGIATACDQGCPVKAGENAVMTFTVGDMNQAVESLREKGAKLVGDVQEVEGHVKMQTVVDKDGNHFQVVQMLGHHKQ